MAAAAQALGSICGNISSGEQYTAISGMQDACIGGIYNVGLFNDSIYWMNCNHVAVTSSASASGIVYLPSYTTANSITTSYNIVYPANQAWRDWTSQHPQQQAQTVGTPGIVTSSQTVWNHFYAEVAQRILTREEAQRVAEESRRLNEELALKAQEREQRRKIADQRAEKLLVMTLDDKQRADFEKDRYFEVISQKSRKRYRITKGMAGNVYVYNEQNKCIERLCIHVYQDVPHYDNMLAQKLMLEADEDVFRRTANITLFAA